MSRRARPSSWEESLGAVLAPRSSNEADWSGPTPLAVELTLAGGADQVRPLLRVVRPGKTGWVGGRLLWSDLDSLIYRGEHPTAHIHLLREFYALYQAHTARYAYGVVKTIDLAEFESSRLWPLLDEAEEIGLRLVHGNSRLGPLDRYDTAEFSLDVRADRRGALAVSPVVQVADPAVDVATIRFIGSSGHGVVYLDRADLLAHDDHNDWRLRLARLTKPVPAGLQQLTQENRQLAVPAAEATRFRQQYVPRLRRAAAVHSSDGSVDLPEVSAPSLVLRADYGDDHALDLTWEWAYEVGDTELRVPLAPGDDDGYRDEAAERSVLTGLSFPFDRFGLTDTDHLAFSGLDTMRFTTEVLPLLADQTEVDVEVRGEPADYREASDAVRIGVSTAAIAGETDWFDLGITITVAGRPVPFVDVFAALSREESHLLLPDGTYFALDKPELHTLRELIEEARAMRDSPRGGLRISRFQAGFWDELSALGVVDQQAEEWQRQTQGLLSLDSVAAPPLPAGLRARLRPYQLSGFSWLAFLWDNGLGGILADDMGLGKTLQTLALICHARAGAPGAAPFLIVAPTSVVANWAAEAARFAPGLAVATITDTLRRRGQSLDEAAAGADVVITSYTLFRLDFDAHAQHDWSALVLDEAQFVKNHQAKVHRCARELSAPFKLAITGTPMENNLMELWSLLSITAPGLFPSPTRFQDYYARPIEKTGDAELLARLRRRVRPLITRRTKEQVAVDLPPKQEQVVEVELHPRHRKIYQTHLQRERQKVLGLLGNVDKHRFTILTSLTLLRQLSLHAGLVDDQYDHVPSVKVDALVEQLADVAGGGHRALVFSQFTGFLAKVRERLNEEGLAYCYLDGKTRNRKQVLATFKEGTAPVFLISLKAGGFGLNLQEADYCFLLDPWWNPATEAQAVDRTHRIGQTRTVMVYRLVAKDTIEEKVMALKAKKAELFANVMDDGDYFDTTLTAEDLRSLFEPSEHTSG
ncbi:DEAD/DEAH box helicase [Actinokineospora sp. NBRC 105648]|uniref:DEAD/DEAH box helicase n=1 Tax=Actinokineospora sp. NBRC 105648 TaxID=3032206 RepID=UPI0024A1C7BD|nr:DEAD/DEAH box helicase [Actinokineospora sp. NBRC 105648]GLZ42221.1 DNA helicase [Actinokineospora sp. NBRC 105648]